MVKIKTNKCIGDDTKAAARQSLNCIKNKKKYGEKRVSIWWMELLHSAMWHNHDIDFAMWLHPAMWQVTLGDMPWNSPNRPPYWNSTSGFDFDHITAVDMSFCTSLRNFMQTGPPSAEKNDVVSIFMMTDLSHLGFYRSNNGFFEIADIRLPIGCQ